MLKRTQGGVRQARTQVDVRRHGKAKRLADLGQVELRDVKDLGEGKGGDEPRHRSQETTIPSIPRRTRDVPLGLALTVFSECEAYDCR